MRFSTGRPDARSCPAGEAPDSVFRTDRGVLGIEVTQFAPDTLAGRPRPEELDSLRQRVMSLARVQYGGLGGAPPGKAS